MSYDGIRINPKYANLVPKMPPKEFEQLKQVRGEKKFEAGKKTSYDIDAQLRQGNRLLKIRRLGEGTETKYSVSPA